MIRHPGLGQALADLAPLVRARAARTAGELGRTDLRPALNALLTDDDEECRFWAAWSAGRLGTTQGMRDLAIFARSAGRWADDALALLLRRLTVERAHAFVSPLNRDPARRSAVIQATGWIGDALYVPWLIGQTNEPAVARVAGDAFATITGADIADLRSAQTADQPAQPNDNPLDENVALDVDAGIERPDPEKLAQWWEVNRGRFTPGTAYFLGIPKESTDWITAISRSSQGHRRAASLELALRNPDEAMFEVRARGDLQRQLLQKAGGAS
jgi:uncharacterized protein (TIGR02270 family)